MSRSTPEMAKADRAGLAGCELEGEKRTGSYMDGSQASASSSQENGTTDGGSAAAALPAKSASEGRKWTESQSERRWSSSSPSRV